MSTETSADRHVQTDDEPRRAFALAPAFSLPSSVESGNALADGFARRLAALARRAGASDGSVRWVERAAFAISRATSDGHVCVPLAALAQRYGATPDEARAALRTGAVVTDLGADARATDDGAIEDVIGNATGNVINDAADEDVTGDASGDDVPASMLRPLVIDADGRLYLARYYDYERQLARALVAHACPERARAEDGESIADDDGINDGPGEVSSGASPRGLFPDPVDRADAQDAVSSGASAIASAAALPDVARSPGDSSATLLGVSPGVSSAVSPVALPDVSTTTSPGTSPFPNGSSRFSPDVSPRALRARLLKFFGAPQDDGVDWQRVAAVLALSGRLTIVSGGPGTGKTTTVAGVLACLLDAHPCGAPDAPNNRPGPHDLPDLRIALAAPTGKAAQRMLEALCARAAHLPPALAARLPRASYTLHRLLGQGPDGQFRYRRENPLPYDVAVIDEASMIDVALAAHLFDALAPATRLVLLGDKDQLAAVEAGAVFAELSARPSFSAAMRARLARALDLDADALARALPDVAQAGGAPPSAIHPWAASPQCHETTGRPHPPCAARAPTDAARLPADSHSPRVGDLFADEAECAPPSLERSANAPFSPEYPSVDASPAAPRNALSNTPQNASPDGLLTDCVVWLARNYRFGLTSAIGQAADAIRRGAVRDAFDALARDPAAAALFEDADVMLSDATLARLDAGFASYREALARALAEGGRADPEPLFDALNRFRVLCATRAGGRGVAQLNAQLGARIVRDVQRARDVHDARRAPPPAAFAALAPWFAGRPVMVTRNDYALGLFNGDVGIALPAQDGALRVWFRGGDDRPGGRLRALSPAALPPHDTAFALTVHKSQGSEFDHVALVLPARGSAVLTRELVYTAITRARVSAHVYGARAVLAEAIATPTRRDSGLAARIAGFARTRRA